MKAKKKKLKISKFVLINIVVLGLFCLFYGYRLIHFYRIENPRIKKNETLYKLVTMKKNLVTIGDGLYKEDNNYIYKGKNVDNYVKYSGRIWRIVKTIDNNIKLISSDLDTSLVWGVNTNYTDSLIRNYLNNESTIKSYYESLANKEILVDTETCIDNYNEGDYSCNEKVKDKVGLISIYEYQNAGGLNSYLNIGKYFWTSNVDDQNNSWYVYKGGTLNNNSNTGKTYFVYGVRPTITVKGDTKVLKGKGTIEEPFDIDIDNGNSILNSKYVGEYIKYSDYIWRIIETDENYVKVVLNGVIEKDNEKLEMPFGNSNYMDMNNKVGSYLNNDFYNTLNKESIIKHEFNLGRYDKTYKYDYTKVTEYKESLYIGLLQMGELFVNDFDNCFMMARTITSDKTIYQVLPEGKIYAGSLSDERYLRPAMYLKPDLSVTGKGTIDDPYMIG